MQKLYTVTYKDSIDIEDCLFTLNWDRALELLNKNQNEKQIIEYTFDSNGVSECWNAFHYYKDGIFTTYRV